MDNLLEYVIESSQDQTLVCCDDALAELNEAIKDAINCMAGVHVALHNDFDKDELIADLTTAIYRLKGALYK